MNVDETVENILEHYGVKGMKWGVRKDGSTSSTTVRESKRKKPATDITVSQKPGRFVQTKGGKRQIATEDAVRNAAQRQLAKKSTTDSLSTKQLQDVVTRMNLEQQYAQLSKKADRRGAGERLIARILDDPEVKKFANSQVEAALNKK
jgi:hypothetical protein